MTVSRAVKGQPKVGEATRARVLAIAKELRYTPNLAARRLATAHNFRVGVIFSNMTGAYVVEFLVGLLDESLREGAELLLEKCETTAPAALRATVRRLARSEVGGVLIAPPLCESEPLLEALERAGISAVSVATGKAMSGRSGVRIDDYAASYELTKHLLDLGHRRLGFVTGNPKLSCSSERLRGFNAALADAGDQAEEPLIVPGLFSFRSGLEAGRLLLHRADAPSAIFASNDDMAAAVVSVAHSCGLDVPRDLSVVGFDDTPIASAVWPELTTIRQPIARMARVALKILATQMKRRAGDDEAAIVDRVVKYELVTRGSAAPYQARR